MSPRRRQEPGDGDRGERFVRDVLARTSGSGCDRALQMLPQLQSGELADMDRRLVLGHVEHCQGCRAVAVVLGWLDEELPALAVVDPGPAFTARVLAATSGRAAAEARRRRLTGAAGLMDRLGRWWEAQILKPIFPLQAAYVATVMVVLLTTGPWAPLRGLPGRALQLVQAGPAGQSVADQAMAQASAWAEEQVQGLAAAAAAPVQARWLRIGADLQGRVARTADERAALAGHVDALAAGMGQAKLEQVGFELLAAGRTLRGLWHDWWIAEDPTGSREKERSTQ